MPADCFGRAFATTLRYEGGDSNHADDPGGRTRYGISQAQYPDLDIGSLTITQAKDIYRRDYWEKYRCHELPHALAVCFFDAVVNHAPTNPIKWLQRAVGAKPDGILGGQTLMLARACVDVPRACGSFTVQRVEYVKTLRTYGTFGVGWHARHVGVLVEALRPV